MGSLEILIKENEADGIKRVSNLIASVKNIIDKNADYKAVFKDIEFDITNDKEDDEIIASGVKPLNVNFRFTENGKLISSSLKLNVDLQGKNRKEINQYLADNFTNDLMNFSNLEPYKGQFRTTFVQTVFANKSIYQDLINELILFAPKNNFYLWTGVINTFDNSDSAISVDFTIEGKTKEKLTEQISITDSKQWKQIKLEFQVFIGNGLSKSKRTIPIDFYINVMKENYIRRELFLYISKLREELTQSLFKYKLKTKIGDVYSEAQSEIGLEFDRVKQTIMKPEDIDKINLYRAGRLTAHESSLVISTENLLYNKYSYTMYGFNFEKSVASDPDLPLIPAYYWYYLIEEK